MTNNYLIKALSKSFFTALVLLVTQNAFSQVATVPDTSKMKYNEISSKMKLYVFPAKGQSQQQQKIDEFECYKWATEQSGIDPLNLPKVEVKQAETGANGQVVGSAAKGAAAGVAIGAIAGDAGKGAAIGATAGAMGGVRKKRAGDAQAQQNAQAQAQQTEADIKNNYIKAFSVCIEGKGYTIK
jgi:hypothetical protein